MIFHLGESSWVYVQLRLPTTRVLSFLHSRAKMLSQIQNIIVSTCTHDTYLVHCFVTQEQKNWFGEFYLELYARTYQAEVQHSTYYAVLGDGQTTI